MKKKKDCMDIIIHTINSSLKETINENPGFALRELMQKMGYSEIILSTLTQTSRQNINKVVIKKFSEYKGTFKTLKKYCETLNFSIKYHICFFLEEDCFYFTSENLLPLLETVRIKKGYKKNELMELLNKTPASYSSLKSKLENNSGVSFQTLIDIFNILECKFFFHLIAK